MPMFRRADSTGKGRTSHSHVVYQLDDGTGVSSVDRKHSHQLILEDIQETTIQIDPVTNFPQEVTQVTGQKQVLTPGPDGHVHELSDIEMKGEEEKEKPEKIVEEVETHFKKAAQVNKESRDIASVIEEYLANNQWDTKKAAHMTDSDRAIITLNTMSANLKYLSGIQRQNRTDLKYFPVEDGDARVADILSFLVKVILRNTNYWQEETELFEKQSSCGLGVFHVYEDFDDDVRGQIKIVSERWQDVFFGPHYKKDLSDLEYLVVRKRFTRDNLIGLFPEKKKEIEDLFNDIGFSTLDEKEIGRPSELFAHATTVKTYEPMYGFDKYDRSIYMHEMWRKTYSPAYVFIDTTSPEEVVISLEDYEDADIAKIKKIDGYKVISRSRTRMRVTKTAGSVLMDDEYPELSFQGFHHIPVYAEKYGDKWFGKGHLGKDMQDEINKRFSNMVDIMNKTNGYGIMYEEDAFEEGVNEDALRKKFSTPGFCQKVTDITKIKIMEGIGFPAELDKMNQITLQMQDIVLGMNRESMAPENRPDNSVGMMQQERTIMLGNEYLFDNLSMAKKHLGRIVVSKIPNIYTVERIKRIINNQALQEEVMVANKPLNQYSKEEIQEMIEEIVSGDLTKYDVAVDETSFSVTSRMAWFLMMKEMAQQGIPVDPSVIIELSPLPQFAKTKMIEGFAQQAQATAEADDKKYNTEIVKTAIAQGNKVGQGIAQQ